MAHVVSANKLDDGRVVYLNNEGIWVKNITGARVALTEEEALTILAIGENSENQGVVVGAYLVEVQGVDKTLMAKEFRESIRANGPTRRTDM